MGCLSVNCETERETLSTLLFQQSFNSKSVGTQSVKEQQEKQTEDLFNTLLGKHEDPRTQGKRKVLGQGVASAQLKKRQASRTWPMPRSSDTWPSGSSKFAFLGLCHEKGNRPA